jgi:DNA-binding ferritin-like protein (Dps family)
MANQLLEQHEELRSQERKLAMEMKSHETRAEVIGQDFRTTVKSLNSTTKTIDYLRCLETLLKYRYIIETMKIISFLM